MPAHLARHMSAMHGRRRKANGKRGRPMARRVGRPRKVGARRGFARRVGRPRGTTTSVMKLARMSIEQLGALIDAARVEARRRISQLSDAFS
jgi:hypothetical protein